MGGCQNYDPFWGTLNISSRIIIGIQKGTIILTSTHVQYIAHDISIRAMITAMRLGSCTIGSTLAVSTSEGSGFRVQGLGFRVEGLGFRLGVWGLGFN